MSPGDGRKTGLFHLCVGTPTQCSLGWVSDGVRQQTKYSTDFLQGFNELMVVRHYTSPNDQLFDEKQPSKYCQGMCCRNV